MPETALSMRIATRKQQYRIDHRTKGWINSHQGSRIHLHMMPVQHLATKPYRQTSPCSPLKTENRHFPKLENSFWKHRTQWVCSSVSECILTSTSLKLE